MLELYAGGSCVCVCVPCEKEMAAKVFPWSLQSANIFSGLQFVNSKYRIIFDLVILFHSRTSLLQDLIERQHIRLFINHNKIIYY